MKKLNSNGFSPLHVFLLIVMIGMISGTGYYVYNSQKKTNQSLDNATKSQGEPQKSVKKSEENSDKTQTDSNARYFVIKEWGVRIKTSGFADDLYYKANGAQSMDIYSKSADSVGVPGGKTCNGEYIAFLKRYTVNDSSQNDPQNIGPFTKIKDLDGYTYWATIHKEYVPDCFYESDGTTLNQSVADKFESIARTFKTDSLSIQKTK